MAWGYADLESGVEDNFAEIEELALRRPVSSYLSSAFLTIRDFSDVVGREISCLVLSVPFKC